MLHGQGGTPGFAPRTVRYQAQCPSTRLGSNGNVQIGGWQNARTALGPLDQTECAAVEIVADAEELQFLRIGEPVQVEMVGAQLADFVRLDQGKGRAFHRAGMAEAAQDAAREGGLAGAEVAMQVDHPLPPAGPGDAPAQFEHRVFPFGGQDHFRHGLHSSSN